MIFLLIYGTFYNSIRNIFEYMAEYQLSENIFLFSMFIHCKIFH